MPPVIDTEVCVVGGGPAGATIARRLVQLGHRVCLLHAAPFRRRHLGESLPPSILPVLDGLGLRQTVEEAGFLRPEGTIVHWSAAGDSRNMSPGDRGFQVDRRHFDALLLDAANTSGVQVLQSARTVHLQCHPRHGWSISVRVTGAAPLPCIRARVLVDATGRRGLRPRRRIRTTAPTLALYGSWHGVLLDSAETRVEAGPDAWYWGAPLSDGSVNAAVFLDTTACTGVGRAEIMRLYQAHLARSLLLRPCLTGCLDGSVLVCDATGYAEMNPIDTAFLRVGDAACTLDPLSSQGVHMAMLSALQGSIVLHTILTAPDQADAALEFYRTRQGDAVARSRRIAAQLYAAADRFAAAPFWQRRAAPVAATPAIGAIPRVVMPLCPQQCLGLSEALRVVDTPAIVDDLIRRVPALVHPALAQPVAFLGPTALAPLLTDFMPGRTAEAILQLWTQRLALRDGMRILHWLWQMGIVIPTTPPVSQQ